MKSHQSPNEIVDRESEGISKTMKRKHRKAEDYLMA